MKERSKDDQKRKKRKRTNNWKKEKKEEERRRPKLKTRNGASQTEKKPNKGFRDTGRG